MISCSFLSLPFIPATKSIMVNSHTCSLQIHSGMVQCLQSEWYDLHELHYTTRKWTYYHWKWCNYTSRAWKEVVHMWCKRQLRKLWTEACHHCIGRVGISCTGPLQPHSTSTQLCSWDLWVRLSTSDGSHGCSCLPSCLMICFYTRSTFDHLVFKNFLLVYGFFIQLFFIWLKENGIFEIWNMEKRNEDEYLLWQSYKFIYLFF